ncbi:MAG: acetyl-CoA hydrolase/transferase family protein [Acidimicrobiales bacterium]
MTAREMVADEAAAMVRTRDSVGFGLITATPGALLGALSRRSDWEDLTVCGGLTLGNFALFTHPGVHYRCQFMGGADRHYRDQGGDVQYVPSFFRHYGVMMQRLGIRVMLVAGSMPDAHGEVSVSLYNGATLEECRRAGRDPSRLLIVECSPHYPRTLALEGHSNTLSLDEIDVVVYTDEHPMVIANEAPTPVDEAIARHAAPFIPDGATLQTGIGAVPSLVAQALAAGQGGDYGIHSEMFTDGLYQLMRVGKVTNQRKTINRGVGVITFSAGSQELYDFIHENPLVRMAPVQYTNDPSVIAKNHRMVSINSALEVDLLGQLGAESIGARQFSGVGGHQDFVEGTSLSTEHVSLICLPSTATTASGERRSRIVASMSPQGAVTSPRQLAGVVVTEHGAADLRGRTVRERAVALAAVADPAFRDELAEHARHLG